MIEDLRIPLGGVPDHSPSTSGVVRSAHSHFVTVVEHRRTLAGVHDVVGDQFGVDIEPMASDEALRIVATQKVEHSVMESLGDPIAQLIEPLDEGKGVDSPIRSETEDQIAQGVIHRPVGGVPGKPGFRLSPLLSNDVKVIALRLHGLTEAAPEVHVNEVGDVEAPPVDSLVDPVLGD